MCKSCQITNNIRGMIGYTLKLFLTCGFLFFYNNSYPQSKVGYKNPVIVVTDLYHPYQDPGDNFDLITAYALPEIDLKAIILDCTEVFRKPLASDPGKGLFPDSNGPRDPGFIPVLQLNYIFGRNVPVAVGPFSNMKNIQDKMLDIPAFQQQGVELILKTLKESSEPVQIASFGSARSIAAAYNRDPVLFRKKVKQIHLSAGTSAPVYLEWNVALDTTAVVCLLRSELPIAIYPCAAANKDSVGYGSKNYPFSYDIHNTYYKLTNLSFIEKMDPKLQRYLKYAYGRVCRTDFLRCMDSDSIFTVKKDIFSTESYVWETAIWINISGRRLVKTDEGDYRIKSFGKVLKSDLILPNNLINCTIKVETSGLFSFSETKNVSNFSIFYRGDIKENEKALRSALPFLYQSFKP